MAVKRFARAFCALVFLCGLSYGQSTTGTLLGVVADPSDAAIPKARVELTNTATGAVISTTTEAEGIFRFNSLIPATYNLTIKATAGFKTYAQSNVEVTGTLTRYRCPLKTTSRVSVVDDSYFIGITCARSL